MQNVKIRVQRTGRNFTGKKLRELTVHHKDHNFMNNQSTRRQQLGTAVYLLPRQRKLPFTGSRIAPGSKAGHPKRTND
jgi:hypothetical protein